MPSSSASGSMGRSGMLRQPVTGWAGKGSMSAVSPRAPGPAGSCSVTIVGGIPAGTTDVVINLDAQDGDTGLYDSGSAILGALAANGQTTYQVVAPEVAPLGLDFVGAGVSRVWVCTGSFPSDDRLTTTDGDFLANLNAIDGIGVYFEGGDHWGFAPVASGLDQRDGVTAALDGGDTLTSLSPIANGGVSDLSSAYPGTTGYTQNQAGNDWTDELTIGLGDPDVTVAEAMCKDHGYKLRDVELLFKGLPLGPARATLADGARAATAGLPKGSRRRGVVFP